jgi:hypothetical protein
MVIVSRSLEAAKAIKLGNNRILMASVSVIDGSRSLDPGLGVKLRRTSLPLR